MPERERRSVRAGEGEVCESEGTQEFETASWACGSGHTKVGCGEWRGREMWEGRASELFGSGGREMAVEAGREMSCEGKRAHRSVRSGATAARRCEVHRRRAREAGLRCSARRHSMSAEPMTTDVKVALT